MGSAESRSGHNASASASCGTRSGRRTASTRTAHLAAVKRRRRHRLTAPADLEGTPPTPLPGWTVRQLVNHLVNEERWTPPLLAGATIEEVGSRFDGDLLGDDPVAAFDGAAAAALAVVRAEGALEGTVHLSFGDHPAREYAMQLAADHLVHAWDLARAIGADQTLDTDAVTAVREWFEAMETTYRDMGVIGPRVEIPPTPARRRSCSR